MSAETLEDEFIKRPHSTHLDPLLDSLVIITKLNGHPHSRESLKAALPLVDNKLTPSLFIRAAKRAGFTSRIIRKPLNQISNLLLPCVILLNDNNACVLSKIHHQTQQADLLLPEAEDGQVKISLKELAQKYLGYSIFIKPSPRFEKRADEHRLAKPKSWFWDTLLQYKANYIQVAFCSLLINLFAIANPLFVMNVYDRVVPNNAVETLWALAVGITLAYIFDFLLRLLRGYLIDITGKKADTILASLIYQQTLGIRMEAKPASTGAFANNLHGYEGLRDFFTSATLAGVVDLPFIFLFLWIVSVIGGKIVIIPLLTVPIVIIVSYLLEIPMRKAIEKSYFGASQKQALMIETINGLETIKSLSAEGALQRKWEKYVAMVSDASIKSRFFSSLVVNFTTYAMQMVSVIVVVYGVYLIHDGDLSMGGLIACTILSGRTLAPLGQIASIITRYQQSKLGLSGLDKIMKLPIERPPEKVFVHRPIIKGQIDFINIKFAYPEQQTAALDGVSFSITPGEHVGIIGRIGSGKSSIIKLAMGLFAPQEGSVRIDGTDLAQLDPADIRRNVGYVGQDCTLFYGTVRENITAGAPWADDSTLLKSAELSGVHRFVNRHPSGYDMPTGERGERISGGQRQAIAIARALLPNPQILMFDEPTSATDNTSEREFINKMKVYMQNKTLLLVTHKRTMLDLVERVIVVDNGKIVADGPKEKVFSALAQNKVKAADN